MTKLTEEMVVARSKQSDLSSIKRLNCWGAELTDISILKRMANVEVLAFSINKIRSLNEFQHCKRLKELYVRKNRISDLSELRFLRRLPALKVLWLDENPCAEAGNYRMTVLRALPQLEKLDNVVVQPEEVAGHNPQMMNQQMHNTQVPFPLVLHPQQVPHTQGIIKNPNPSAAPSQPGVQSDANAHLPMGFRRIPPNGHRLMTGDKLSIHEAAKLEMASIPTKTPVSVLQELSARCGTVPKYELVQIEGLDHEPTFRYRVTVSDVVAIGTGRSKKLAKHKAAKTLLDKLAGESQSEIINHGTGSDNAGNGGALYEVNPIGWLQEMCVKRFMPPPRYITKQEVNVTNGAPHECIFTVVCVLMSHRKVGRDKCKKFAKRQAAHKMGQLLQETQQDPVRKDENKILLKNKY